ncbi:hypothetical protein BDB00DRAFT_823086, partial [Zychaea mexicana]|uniref:uncharacterized protein n=1 Tax=Zychaea mexicana TaxID=64656 RepID=UPI0022FEE70F
MRLMYSTFASGIGPKPFMRMLYELHNLRHDGLEHQFVKKREHIQDQQRELELKHKQRMLNSMVKRIKIAKFSSFEDTTTGYCGFVPSAKYFTELFNGFVEKYVQITISTQAPYQQTSCMLITAI